MKCIWIVRWIFMAMIIFLVTNNNVLAESNLEPTEEQIQAGHNFLGNIEKVKSIESPLLLESFGIFELKFIDYFQKDNNYYEKLKGAKYSMEYYKAYSMSHYIMQSDYDIAWQFKKGNGASLRIVINSAYTCITMKMLEARFGRGAKSYSTDRHFALGDSPAPGLLPRQVSISYAMPDVPMDRYKSTKDITMTTSKPIGMGIYEENIITPKPVGLNEPIITGSYVTFGFNFVCADYVNIHKIKSEEWVPTEAELDSVNNK